MFESHSSVMLLVDPETGVIVEANEAAARFYGSTVEALQGTRVQEFHPDGADLTLAEIRELAGVGDDGSLLVLHRTSAGLRHVEVHVSPVDVGARALHFAIIHDVTERVRAEEERRRGEAKFRALIEYALDLTLVVDEEGTLTFVSPSLQRILGHAPEDLVGQSAKSLMHPEDYEELREEWGRLMTEPENVARMTFRMRAGSGQWRIMDANARNLLQTEEVAGVVFNARDVTEATLARSRLIERETQLAEAQRLANVGSWEWDLESDELVWSDQLKRIFGLAPDQRVTMDLYSEHIEPEDRDDITGAVQACLEDFEPYEVQHRIRRADGAERVVVAQGRVVVDEYDSPLKLYGSCQDVTELLAQQQELQEYAGRLEASNRELEEFAYVASHDLQEPLRKIRAFGGRLQRAHADELGERGVDYLDRMSSAAERMSTLIEDLLTYSRVTTRARPYERVSAGEILTGVLSDLEISCAESGACIDVGEMPELDADPLQLRQLFQNLIGNAVKFRKPGEPPRVTVSARVVPGPKVSGGAPVAGAAVPVKGVERVEIVVSDSGIGFDQKYADNIFMPFQRLHGRKEYTGTGIGLAICRKIAEQHHGTINAFSAPGEGATFVVNVPRFQLKHQKELH
jgi:PAS domain S-box-containing protein